MAIRPLLYCVKYYTGILCETLQVYWLPPEAGEKVSLGVTVLLAFSVFQLVISDSVPENSDVTPLLSTLKKAFHFMHIQRAARKRSPVKNVISRKRLTPITTSYCLYQISRVYIRNVCLRRPIGLHVAFQ